MSLELEWTTPGESDSFHQTVAVKNNGTIYVAGVKFGPILMENGDRDGDIYVTGLDKNGDIVWTNLIRTSGIDYPTSIATSSDGSLYLAGVRQRSIDGQNNGPIDTLIVKFDNNGNKQWERIYGVTDGSTDEYFPGDVAISTDGAIYIAGTRNRYNVEGGDYMDGFEEWDGFIAKYNSGGELLWSRSIESSKNLAAGGLRIGTDGKIYLSGTTDGDIDEQRVNGTNDDAFVSSYNSDGSMNWTRLFGSQRNESISFEINTDGDIILSGSTYGGGTEDVDAFMTKIKPNGDTVWTKSLNTTGDDFLGSIEIGENGIFYAFESSNLDLNGDGAGSYSLNAYDSNGVQLYSLLNETGQIPNMLYRDGYLYFTGSNTGAANVPYISKYRTPYAVLVDQGSGTLGAITSSTPSVFQEGVTLTAPVVTGDPDGDASNPNYVYQWFKGGNIIAGATASTYSVPASGAGTYKVAVTYTDAQSFTATVDSPDQVISTINTITPSPITAPPVQEGTGTPGTPAVDPVNGTNGKDLLKGTGENDVITGFGGADRHTGGAGADIFRYTALSDSRLSSLDRITDLLIGTDKIDAPRAVSARNVKQLGKVSFLKQAGIQQVLGSNNPLGKQVFGAHRAATFTLGTGGGTRTFLAINDATPGFNANTDALIEITGFKGNLNNLGII